MKAYEFKQNEMGASSKALGLLGLGAFLLLAFMALKIFQSFMGLLAMGKPFGF